MLNISNTVCLSWHEELLKRGGNFKTCTQSTKLKFTVVLIAFPGHVRASGDLTFAFLCTFGEWSQIVMKRLPSIQLFSKELQKRAQKKRLMRKHSRFFYQALESSKGHYLDPLFVFALL